MPLASIVRGTCASDAPPGRGKHRMVAVATARNNSSPKPGVLERLPRDRAKDFIITPIICKSNEDVTNGQTMHNSLEKKNESANQTEDEFYEANSSTGDHPVENYMEAESRRLQVSAHLCRGPLEVRVSGR